jgi:hypothetical protein
MSKSRSAHPSRLDAPRPSEAVPSSSYRCRRALPKTVPTSDLTVLDPVVTANRPTRNDAYLDPAAMRVTWGNTLRYLSRSTQAGGAR